MCIIKKVKDLGGILDIDLQLVASELDTSVNDMEYMCRDILEDKIQMDSFDRLIKDIEIEEGVEVYSFNDNTILYEYLNEPVIIHNMLGVKYVIFDNIISRKMKARITSYK